MAGGKAAASVEPGVGGSSRVACWQRRLLWPHHWCSHISRRGSGGRAGAGRPHSRGLPPGTGSCWRARPGQRGRSGRRYGRCSGHGPRRGGGVAGTAAATSVPDRGRWPRRRPADRTARAPVVGTRAGRRSARATRRPTPAAGRVGGAPRRRRLRSGRPVEARMAAARRVGGRHPGRPYPPWPPRPPDSPAATAAILAHRLYRRTRIGRRAGGGRARGGEGGRHRDGPAAALRGAGVRAPATRRSSWWAAVRACRARRVASVAAARIGGRGRGGGEEEVGGGLGAAAMGAHQVAAVDAHQVAGGEGGAGGRRATPRRSDHTVSNSLYPGITVAPSDSSESSGSRCRTALRAHACAPGFCPFVHQKPEQLGT